MKSPIVIVGILLVILGILALSYQGFSYTTQDKVAEIGSLKVIDTSDKYLKFPPYLGGLALGVGLVLLVIGRRK
jgi:uncharacterized membrane protein